MSTQSMQTPRFEHRGMDWKNLDWSVVLGIAAMHLGSLAAPFYFTWSGLAVMILFVWLTGNVGITLCYHRLLTHRSFKTPKWFEYFITLMGCLAWQGGPIQWVGVHRIHHRHSDDEDDPHTPNHGFGWAHMFWCMRKDPGGKRRAEDAAKDLQRDVVHRLINRYFWVPQLPLLAVMYFAGQWIADAGVSWLLWGVCVRVVLVYHGTWFVNSASHTWGYRNYETKDQSTNLWWVALVSFGEGWHNNHHAHQRSAAHGLRWFELDITYWTIRFLGLIGLARHIVLPKPEQRP